VIDRRLFLAGAGAVALTGSASAATPLPPGGRLSFVIIREGAEIGSHKLVFSKTGSALVVDIDVSIVVRLGPIPLYRYTHRAVETWDGGSFVSLVSETNDNGKPHRLRCDRKGGAIRVSGTVGDYAAPQGATPATHWRRAMLDGPMINTQDGKLLRPKIAKLGRGQVVVANGKSIAADKFGLSGDVDLETWYDAAPSWAGLRFKGEDGSEIRYQRA
jgi:hypothetical protein